VQHTYINELGLPFRSAAILNGTAKSNPNLVENTVLVLILCANMMSYVAGTTFCLILTLLSSRIVQRGFGLRPQFSLCYAMLMLTLTLTLILTFRIGYQPFGWQPNTILIPIHRRRLHGGDRPNGQNVGAMPSSRPTGILLCHFLKQ